MTASFIDEDHLDDADPKSVGRTLDLARLALRVREAVLLSAEDHAAFGQLDATLAMPITDAATSFLVVRDEPGRHWSDEDGAMLRHLAASLAAETELRRQLDLYRANATGAPAPQDVQAEPPEAGHDTGGGLRILLADDLDLNRKLICDMLSLDGYLVDSVADGAAAVEAVKGNSYDLVLMDMIMPGMDGMDATRAIRALPAPACDVPIVALTAHSFREQLDNCIDAGMNATLTKPMSIDALSAAVVTWARVRQAA